MRPSNVAQLALVSLLFVLAGCGGAAATQPAPATAPPAVPTASAVPSPEAGPEPTGQHAAFPTASPESQGLMSEALHELAAAVRGYYEAGMIVGGELVVIKNGHVVLHETVGWSDREAGTPLEPGTLFNIRSMTKPVLGTAVQMLIDEGALSLDDRASDHLAAFDNDEARDITIAHLITHRSGLPYSVATGDSIATLFHQFDGFADIAAKAGEAGLAFVPGTDFLYSDAGADSLGAIVEKASGTTLDVFFEQRILTPLGMVDTLTLVDSADPRYERIASSYHGAPGDWERYWGQGDDPLFPFTMGSQSLYSTPLDYARFLQYWLERGGTDGPELMSAQAFQRGLGPVSDMGDAIHFPGLRVYYGQMWTLYTAPDAPPGEDLVVFGHNGADGTWAWVWPERDLMILYFTNSRGQSTGLRLEKVIDRALIRPEVEPSTVSLPAEYEILLGPYTAYSGELEGQTVQVVAENGRLAVDIPSMIVYELQAPDDQGIWRAAYDPAIAVSFVPGEDGTAAGMWLYADGAVSELARGTEPVPLASPTQPPDPEPVVESPALELPQEAASGDAWTRPTDGKRMVYVPGGAFDMGSTDADIDRLLEQCPACQRGGYIHEQPQHTAHLDAFWIDQTEVTNDEYRQCVEAGACSPLSECDWGPPSYDDPEKGDHPAVCMKWKGALNYCLWAGGRLPTEAEWEKAARGTDGRAYPWGDEFDGTLLNYCDASCPFDQRDAAFDDGYELSAPVGTYPGGASPYGVLDMAGNVWEYVADSYDPHYYAVSPDENPPGPEHQAGESRVVRGGSWYTGRSGMRSANRYATEPGQRYALLGFRCVVAGEPGP